MKFDYTALAELHPARSYKRRAGSVTYKRFDCSGSCAVPSCDPPQLPGLFVRKSPRLSEKLRLRAAGNCRSTRLYWGGGLFEALISR
jgi:hypothetical protein